jgi:hypothetical protein
MAAFDDGTGSPLWVVGNFTSIAGLPAQGIARFDGVDNWTTMLPGADDTIFDVEVFDDGSGPALYVGGSFTSVGGVRAEGVARLDCPPVFGDLDGDGFVNGFDLALLLGQWTGAALYSPCPPHAPADLLDDCKINGADLAVLLSWWTPASR